MKRRIAVIKGTRKQYIWERERKFARNFSAKQHKFFDTAGA